MYTNKALEPLIKELERLEEIEKEHKELIDFISYKIIHKQECSIRDINDVINNLFFKRKHNEQTRYN